MSPGAAARAALKAGFAKGVTGGALQAVAYGAAVWAMSVTALGAVSTLRETSVIFAAALGELFGGGVGAGDDADTIAGKVSGDRHAPDRRDVHRGDDDRLVELARRVAAVGHRLAPPEVAVRLHAFVYRRPPIARRPRHGQRKAHTFASAVGAGYGVVPDPKDIGLATTRERRATIIWKDGS